MWLDLWGIKPGREKLNCDRIDFVCIQLNVLTWLSVIFVILGCLWFLGSHKMLVSGIHMPQREGNPWGLHKRRRWKTEFQTLKFKLNTKTSSKNSVLAFMWELQVKSLNYENMQICKGIMIWITSSNSPQ